MHNFSGTKVIYIWDRQQEQGRQKRHIPLNDHTIDLFYRYYVA